MLTKIKLFVSYVEVEFPGKEVQKVMTNQFNDVYFNTSLIKLINVLQLDKKTVWKLSLVDGETLFTAPFKLK